MDNKDFPLPEIAETLKRGSTPAAQPERGEESNWSQRDRSRLTAFFGISLALSWAVWLWPIDKERSIYLWVHGLYVGVPLVQAKELAGNCLPGAVAVAFALVEGRDSLRRIAATLLRWRSSPRWYAFSLFLPLAVAWASIGLVLLLSP